MRDYIVKYDKNGNEWRFIENKVGPIFMLEPTFLCYQKTIDAFGTPYFIYRMSAFKATLDEYSDKPKEIV